MPTAISCTCGKSFRVPDHLQGKAVKCPACGEPIAVPASESSSAAAQSAGSEADGLEGLLDEVELKASSTGRRCPECRTDMLPDDVLCVKCGYNTETGRKLGTRRTGRKQESGKPVGRFRAQPARSAMQATLMKVLGLLVLIGIAVYLALRTAGKVP